MSRRRKRRSTPSGATGKNDGTARVTIVEPEELEGISASFSGGSMTLLYEDVSLAAGTVSAEELSPAQVLPLVVQAIREGYILEKGTDKVDGVPCLRLVFDTTGEQGGKIYTHVWFAEKPPAGVCRGRSGAAPAVHCGFHGIFRCTGGGERRGKAKPDKKERRGAGNSPRRVFCAKNYCAGSPRRGVFRKRSVRSPARSASK